MKRLFILFIIFLSFFIVWCWKEKKSIEIQDASNINNNRVDVLDNVNTIKWWKNSTENPLGF